MRPERYIMDPDARIYQRLQRELGRMLQAEARAAAAAIRKDMVMSSLKDGRGQE